MVTQVRPRIEESEQYLAIASDETRRQIFAQAIQDIAKLGREVWGLKTSSCLLTSGCCRLLSMAQCRWMANGFTDPHSHIVRTGQDGEASGDEKRRRRKRGMWNCIGCDRRGKGGHMSD